MNAITPIDLGKDINIIRLAREVAIDHYPINDILLRYGISAEIWDELQEWPRFKELVEIERQNWHSATNTNARIRLKAGTLIEDWMEPAYAILHDKKETTTSKIEIIKILGKFSGMDQPPAVQQELAGRVTINIKIGDTKLAYEGDGGRTIDAVTVNEDDPDTIGFDWAQEFPVEPTDDAEALFENVTSE